MTIDLKDEYATLRQEMLERFDRIHDTAKYGIGAFIAFLSYYFTTDFDDFIALTILQLLVALGGAYVLRLYRSIYTVGTYIAIVIEGNSKAKWHRMSRQVGSYEERKGGWMCRLPYPLGKRWGADSAMYAILVLVLMLLGLSVVILKADTLSALRPLRAIHWFLLALSITFVVCNLIIFYQLWWGMRNFTNNTVKTWKEYCRAFGNDFDDTYSDIILTDFSKNKDKKE